MELYEQKEVTIGDTYYIITAFGTSYGMTILDKMMKGGNEFSVKEMKDIIMKGVKVNNKVLDEKKFDIHFSRKYKEMLEVFNEVMAFNFGDLSELDPNELGDVSEEEDISEE